MKCVINRVIPDTVTADTDFLPATKFATLNLFLLSLKITRHLNTHPIIDPNIDKYPKDSMHILQICFTWSNGDVLFIDESYFMLYMDNSKSIDVNMLGKTTDSGDFSQHENTTCGHSRQSCISKVLRSGQHVLFSSTNPCS